MKNFRWHLTPWLHWQSIIHFVFYHSHSGWFVERPRCIFQKIMFIPPWQQLNGSIKHQRGPQEAPSMLRNYLFIIHCHIKQWVMRNGMLIINTSHCRVERRSNHVLVTSVIMAVTPHLTAYTTVILIISSPDERHWLFYETNLHHMVRLIHRPHH